jgi:transcriptional regulator with XRE-family HTH domain
MRITKEAGYPHLRLVFSREDSSGYKSGRNSERDTPDIDSSVRTRSAGTPARRHLSTACREMPNRFANELKPTISIARSTGPFSSGFADMPMSQPQVDFTVNLPLVARLNPGLHAFCMSPLGKTIKNRLKTLGRTQAWLAEQVGVSENAVSKWIKTGEISRSNIQPTADALQISSAHLLDQHPTPELDERWHSFPPAVKQRVLALIDELTAAPKTESSQPKRRA